MNAPHDGPQLTAPVTPALAQRVQEATGQNVFLCYQCVRCTNGCPLAEFFDLQPNQVMRAVQLGQEEMALQAATPWLCVTCETCATRCPQGLDIPAIMDFLTREATARGIQPAVPRVDAFNRAFMREVRLWGRAYEPGMMVEMTVRDADIAGLKADVPMYWQMLRRGKVPILPRVARAPRQVRPHPEAREALAFYPGCSLHGTAGEYRISAEAVCAALDLRLVEPEGWGCCGGSAAHRLDPEEAVRLPAQNLALIERYGFEEVVMPCAACFNRHRVAQHVMRRDPARREAVNAALHYDYQDRVAVSTLLDALLAHVGLERIAGRVERPLEGLRVACYYGCLLTRPPEVTGAAHSDNPDGIDRLMAALGADVVDWPHKVACCGAAHALTRPDVVRTLSGNLLEEARAFGAATVVVACPMCHMNLESRQLQMAADDRLPVLYFTQAMAVAFGLPEEAAALHKNLVDPRPVLQTALYARGPRPGFRARGPATDQ
ncbi:MAG: hypothetical protein Kow0077_26710 [Anaerolineae bacterium]